MADRAILKVKKLRYLQNRLADFDKIRYRNASIPTRRVTKCLKI